MRRRLDRLARRALALVGALVLLATCASTAEAQITASVSWNPNTDSYTVGYRLYWGTAPGTYQTSIDTGNAVSVQITLSPGSVYYFVVRGYNLQNAYGPASTEIQVDLRTPAPTAQITATLGANNVATVAWQTANAASATINGAPVALSGTATFTVTAQTTYTIRATASDGRIATASATVTPTTPTPAPTAQITATLGTNNVATVTWQTANAASATLNGNPVALSGTATFNVTAQTTYTIRAIATDGRIATANATVTPTTPTPAPTAQITATLGANNVATVTWQTANAASATLNGSPVALSGTATFTVTAQTTYLIRATATDGRGATASVTVAPTTAPAPTAQITATLGANNIATVTWQTANVAAATLNGSPVALSGRATFTVTAQTTYTIRATATDGRFATARVTVAPTTAPAPTAQITATLGANNVATVTWQTANAVSATINGSSVALSGTTTLTVTATTTFVLTATAADGRTATASATVTVASSGAPGVPRNMVASVSGSRVTLRWQAPSTGGTPTHYLIYVGTRSGYSDITNGYNVGNVLSFQGDLPRGSYYARARAANASGTSLDSNEVRFNVGRSLNSPTGVAVTWTGTTATFSWVSSSADTEADMPTNYVLEAGTAPGESNVATLNVGNTTAFTTDVPSGTYYVRIRAQNAKGDSNPSEEIEVRTPGTPQGPTGLISVSASGVVDLRWTASAGGYAPTGYVIEAGSSPGLSDLARLQVGNVTRFTTTAPPGVYYVRVRAIYDSGTSLPSNEIVVRR